MTKWDYVRSAVIFLAAIFIFNNFFISLTILESIILAIFLGVCVFHIIDLRDDILQKVAVKRKARDDNSEV